MEAGAGDTSAVNSTQKTYTGKCLRGMAEEHRKNIIMEVAGCSSRERVNLQSRARILCSNVFQVKIGHPGDDTATAEKKDRSGKSYLHRGLKLKA